MASSSSSSPSSFPLWGWDVFLSFRGEDTRLNFTDHLYDALKRNGIRTFRDEEKLERGKPISPELLKAIEESRFAVIILSRNYASSKWCLDELAKIVDCMKEKKLTVVPVFYDVDPSDVRNQRGSFAQVFSQHEEHFKENKKKVQRWRDALREVANVSGWHLQDRHESEVIQEIVGEILRQLDSRVPIVSDEIFGIESRIQKLMNSYLGIGVDDVRFVGLWGMPGIGKTTLARAVYRRIAREFEAYCFLTNVREEAGKHGLVALQKLLLSKTIMTESSINIGDVYEGANVIKNRLCWKRVLIILDDVDQPEQLHALAKRRGWFGRGSRIIVTTRNKRLLIEHDVAEGEIYEARELNYNEALQLFSRKAFKEDRPPKDFVELSKKVLAHAKGLPLALDILGSSLYRTSVGVWESMLSKLKEIPEENIQDKLKISFDGLPELQKKIFLDIACFFKGEDKDRVVAILESCGYHPILGIDNLINKSLITISGKKLWMHDLLEAMGREIVRRESSFEDPNGRSRLWFSEDILHVLKNNTGTEKVEGIVLNSAPQEELHLNAEVFSKMPNLRLLKIHNVHLSQGLSNLSNNLRVMDWHGYPLKLLPMSFSPDKLVELNMPSSHIEQIWKGKKSLPKLKILDLSDSRNLIKVPDLTGTPNLEKLILQGCVNLYEVHPSVGVLKRLTLLNLKDCKSLTSLPCNISSDSLKILILSGCSKLDKMPENLGNMERLEELDVSRTAIIHVPSSILQLKNLQHLCFRGCKGPPPTWPFFTRCLIPSPDIGLVLPTSFLGLCCLTKLDLSYCDLPDGAIPDDLSSLSSLKFLDLSGNKFEHIPESISQLSKLIIIFVKECSRLRSLPKLPSDAFIADDAADCIILETQYREFDFRTSDETGASFICCPKSNQYDDCRGQNVKVSPARRNFKRRRHIWAAIDLGEVISGTSSRVGIPRWFNNQNTDSPATIQLHLDSNDRSNWLGYALYLIFEVHEDERMDFSSFRSEIFEYESKDQDQFLFNFDTDEGPLKQPLVQSVPKVHGDGSRGFWLYVPRLWFAKMSNNVDKWSCIEASITFSSPSMAVKMSGARLVLNEQNAQEFAETVKPSDWNTFNICGIKRQFDRMRSPSHENITIDAFYRKKRYAVYTLKKPNNFVEVKSSGSKLLENRPTSLDTISHEIQECNSKYFSFSTPSQIPGEDQGCKSDSAIRLKTNLQSLLLRCYEVNYAQNKMYKYIFPLSESPLWFRNHGTGPMHNINLPPNLYDNKRWMGFALYARYAINDQATASCDNLHSTISRNFFGLLDTDDRDLEYFMVFPLSRDVFVESHRLLLFYVPRVFFTDKLNQRSCIRAAFGSFSPGVEVEMCGSRVIIKEDLKGLVQTIAGCILRSPDKYHQGYFRSLEDQVKGLLSSVPEAISSTECNPLEGERPIPFGLRTSMQRRIQFLEKVPSSIEHGAEKNSNAFEKYLSQVTAGRASRDSYSNVIQAGAMYFNVLCRSGLVSRALYSLLFKYFQDYWYQRYPYNDCFPQSEIPKFFCCHGGPVEAFSLPPNLFNDSDWIGLALCAAFTVHKIPSLFHDNPDSEIYHSLSCYLTTDTGFWITKNFHVITASEYNRFIWLNQRRFIWLSYIPRGSFSDSLNKWNNLKAHFVSNSQDLEVQKCGHRLVYKKKILDLVATIVQCATTRPHNFEVTNQFEGDENRNNKQCHVDEGETSETPLCIDYQKIRKWTNFLQKHSEEYHLLFEYDCVFPPSEIPELFSHRGNGPSVTIELPSNLHDDSTWIGFALCASFSVHAYPTEFLDSLESEIPHHLICHFETDTASSKPTHVYRTTREEFKWLHLRGFIWLCCIPYWYLPDGMNHCNHIKVSIKSDWPGWTVQECGLRLMYQQDEQEMRQIVLHCSVSFLDNWDLIRRDVAEQDLAENQGYKYESTTLLKRKLEPLLLKIFEGHKIDYHGILFPQDSIPLWFGHQNIGPSIEIQLPTNLYNDETWKGFAICAVLAFPAYSGGNTDSRTSTDIILHLDSNEGCLEPNLVIPLPSSAFVESHQLVVEHVSPMMLHTKLNQWSHIRATVECNGPGVETVMCGIHIMYKQDVEVFVQTMVECVSAIPEAKRVDYYRSSVNRANFVQSRGNRAESNYPCFSPTSESCRRFQSPRRRPSRNRHKVEPESKTFSNEGFPERTSGNYVEPTLPSTSFDCNSDSFSQLKRDLEYLLQNNFEGFYPCHVTDIVLPHTDIPEWFNHQSKRWGHSVTIDHLPPNLRDDSDWMGLALCAAFSVNKHPTLIRRNLDSGFSHKLFCLLDTDIGSVEPYHTYKITEEKFTWLYLREFIWVSYIPRKLWSEDLNLCSSIKATIGQSLKEIEKATVGHLPEEKKNGNSYMPFHLIAKKCGLRLVYQKDMQELQETIIKCVTSPFDNNVEYIHQLIADETRNTEQATEAGCSYRDPYPERLRKPIYQGQSSGSGISFEERPRENQLRITLPVFDRCSVYTSCFPPIKIPEWFSNHSNGYNVMMDPVPPNFHNDSCWIGLALCASFSVYEPSTAILENLVRETSHRLLTILFVEPLHVYWPTRGDVKLLHLGGFMWLSYIPRRSLPDCLTQCDFIMASFFSHSPSLTVQNCGLRLVFRHDEVGFKEVIRHCIASLSDSWGLIRHLTVGHRQRNKQHHDNETIPSRTGSSSEDAEPERLGGSFDHRLKDKGKRVVE